MNGDECDGESDSWECGTGKSTKTDERGSFSIQKCMLQILDLYRVFLDMIPKKLQYNFPKRGSGLVGGGQRPFGIFPKIHPFW